jgi:hypothetical protein
MALTGVSLFLSFVCLRVFELSVENVRWGEIVHAQKGEDVSVDTESPFQPGALCFSAHCSGYALASASLGPPLTLASPQTGPPIDDHRAEFKRNYDAQKGGFALHGFYASDIDKG